MEIITSKSNDNVKFIKSLNEKKERIKNNCYYLEGIKVIDEVLKKDKAIDVKFIAYSSILLERINGGNDMLQKIEKLDSIKKIEFSPEIFEYITDTKTPQGILAVMNIKEYSYEELLNKGNNILLLDKVQDPGNIGTIIRTCDAFNIHDIIYVTGTGDIYSPKTVRSTMGSILRVSFVKIDDKELQIFKNLANNNGYEIIGTSLETSNYIENITFKSNKNIIVFSNEANGISSNVQDICTNLVKINMSDSAESLNVGIAAGIVLHKLYTDNLQS